MSPLTYYRPKTLAEAIELLERARPLAGGTALVPDRMDLDDLFDLQDLGLDGIEVSPLELSIGGFVRLQSLMEALEELLPAFVEVIRQEANWNLRNAATLAGLVAGGDGRSPLLTLLLACNPVIELQPGKEHLSLAVMLQDRGQHLNGRLITEMKLHRPTQLAYHQVARSPADRPLVSAAMGLFEREGQEPIVRIALGGFGEVPSLVYESAKSAFYAEDAVEAARQAYAAADDEWASGEYRGEVAGVLTRRGAKEVLV